MTKMDCSKFCKKTKSLRNSEFCESWCTIGDEIVFSCDLNLKKASKEENNLLNCMFNDIGHLAACNNCSLVCKNNKNPELEKKLEQEKKLEAVIENLKKSNLPINISPDKLEAITESFKKDQKTAEDTQDAIEAVNIARNILEGLSEGRTPNPSAFAIIANHFKLKIKRKRGK